MEMKPIHFISSVILREFQGPMKLLRPHGFGGSGSGGKECGAQAAEDPKQKHDHQTWQPGGGIPDHGKFD